jgi:hypothetical protein
MKFRIEILRLRIGVSFLSYDANQKTFIVLDVWLDIVPLPGNQPVRQMGFRL